MNWVSIGSGNGLSPALRQAITWTNADLLSIGPLGTTFSENWIEILTFSFKKMRLKLSSAKWRSFCPGVDELMWKYSLYRTGRVVLMRHWISHTYLQDYHTEYTHICNDDVIKWKHFPRYWPFVRGFHRSPVNFPHNGQWRGALTFSLICAWIDRWANNGDAGDLRRYRAHYDVIVMLPLTCKVIKFIQI